jgi:hypothetical protein
MGNTLIALDLGDTLKINETGTSVASVYGTLSKFLNLLVPLSFVIAGIILFFLLIAGGFAIIASGGNAKGVEQGRTQVTGAVIGFLVIFAAYWIIQIIQAITGVPILNSTL